MDGSGASPDAREQHGAIAAGRRRRAPRTHRRRLEPVRRGDVGRDPRPQRRAMPGAHRARTPAIGRRRTPARRPRRATRWHPSPGSTADDAAREPGADVVGDHARRPRRRGPVRSRSSTTTRPGRRVDEPRPARELAARRDRQPPVRRPAQVRRERPPVARRPPRGRAGAATARPAAGRAPPHAQVRAGRPVDPVLDTSRRGPCARTALPDDRRLHRRASIAQPPAGIDRAQPGPRAVVITDQDDAPHGPDGERLRRQGEQPARVRRPRPSVSRWPASVPAPSSTASSRNQAAAGRGRSRGDRRPARRRIPRWVRRLEHRRPGDAGGPSNATAARGTSARANSKHLHEGLLRRDDLAGGGRGGQCRRWPLIARLTGVAAPRWYARGINRGPRVPAHPTRRGREAGASPAQSRYGDRPFGAEVRSPILPSPLEPSRERSGASCDPPPDPSFDPEARGSFVSLSLPASGVPVDARSRATDRRRRTPFPALLLLLLAAVLAACSSPAASASPTAVALASPVAGRDADVATDARADGLADRGARLPAHPHRRRGHRGHDPGRADEDRLAHQRGDRDPVRARRGRPGRRQGRGLHPSIPPEAADDPRRRQVRRGRRREDRRPGHRPRDRRRQQLQPAGVDRQAALAGRAGRSSCSRRTCQTALDDIELIGHGGRQARRGRRDDGLDPGAFDEVKAAPPRASPKPRVFYELDASNGYFGPAPDYFGTEMITIAGGDPLTSGTDGVYQIQEEQILDFDPEVILLGDAAYGVTPEQVAERPGWDELTAVKNGDVRPIDDVDRHPARAAARRRPPGPRPGHPPRPRAAVGVVGDAIGLGLRGAVTARLLSRIAMTTTPVPAGAPGRLAMRVTVRRVDRGRGGWSSPGSSCWPSCSSPGSSSGRWTCRPSTTIGILANRLGFHVPVTWPPTAEAIVMDLRLPRVLTAMVVGTGLAVAGATFQGLLRNPLADPYVLGTASGRGARGGDRGAHPRARPGARVRPAAPARVPRRAAVGDRRLPAVADERAGAADLAAAHRLRGRLAAGRRPRDGDVPLGHRPAPDLRLPARRVRRRVVGAARRRRAADHRRQRC